MRKTSVIINVTNERIRLTSRANAGLVAMLATKWLVEAIDRQWYAPKWEPLNPKYLAWKIKHGFSWKLWIMTGWLRDSICSFWSGSRRAFVVGLKPYQILKDHFYMIDLARVLEYGTLDGRIPARPLFRPTMEGIREAVSQNMEIA